MGYQWVPNVQFCQTSCHFCAFNHWHPLTHVGEFFGHAFALFGREQRGLPTSILPSCPTWCKECITFNRGNVLEDWKILQGYPRICRRYAKIWPCYSIAWCTSHLPRLPTSFWRWRHGDICWATSLGLPWTSASCPQFMDPYGSLWIHMDPVISGIGTSYTSWLQGVSNDCGSRILVVGQRHGGTKSPDSWGVWTCGNLGPVIAISSRSLSCHFNCHAMAITIYNYL